jgi:hypothetical protein
MLRKPDTGFAEGKVGDSVQQDPNFTGWMDRLAHPNSPAGGGGPGEFTPGRPVAAEGAIIPAAETPGPQQFVPMQAEPAKPPNPPPATNPRSLGSQVKKADDLMDVDISAEILADGTSQKGTHTSIVPPRFRSPGAKADRSGKITKFKGKFVWRGVITIQTVYKPSENASMVSCYGRGTTDTDVRNRDITLGFHENSHQKDFENYLNDNALPDLPEMSIGMQVTEYQAEISRFEEELKAYFADAQTETESNTDEVGHRKSTGTCYHHILP